MSYSVAFFRLNTLKGTVIILALVILDYSTLRGTNRQILTPEKYDVHPRHFYTGAPLPLHPPPPPPTGHLYVLSQSIVKWNKALETEVFL